MTDLGVQPALQWGSEGWKGWQDFPQSDGQTEKWMEIGVSSCVWCMELSLQTSRWMDKCFQQSRWCVDINWSTRTRLVEDGALHKSCVVLLLILCIHDVCMASNKLCLQFSLTGGCCVLDLVDHGPCCCWSSTSRTSIALQALPTFVSFGGWASLVGPTL